MIRAALGIIAKGAATLSMLSGTSRQLRITRPLLAVDLATLPSWDSGHCPHHDEDGNNGVSIIEVCGELIVMPLGKMWVHLRLAMMVAHWLPWAVSTGRRESAVTANLVEAIVVARNRCLHADLRLALLHSSGFDSDRL